MEAINTGCNIYIIFWLQHMNQQQASAAENTKTDIS